MSFTIEQLPNEPIVVTILNADYRVEAEIPLTIAKTLELFDQLHETVYLVTVFKAQLEFDDAIVGTNTVARGKNPIFHHPKVRQNVFVTTDAMLKMTATGMQGGPFGGLKIPTFDTLEQALKYVRAEIKNASLTE